MKVIYSPKFKRDYKKLPEETRSKVKMAIKRFKKDPFDKSLENHKLKGKLEGLRSFSVDNSHRIIYEFIEGDAYLHEVGDHDIYR